MGWSFNSNGSCLTCKCVTGPAPCPGPITIGISYTVCNSYMQLGPGATVSITGPDGFSASPTVTYQTFPSPSGTRYGGGWSLSGITQVGTYTVTFSGPNTVTNTTTLTVENLCSNVGKSVLLTPSKVYVTVFGCNGRNKGACVTMSGGGMSGYGVSDENGVAVLENTGEWNGGSVFITGTKNGYETATTSMAPPLCYMTLVMYTVPCVTCVANDNSEPCYQEYWVNGVLDTPFGPCQLDCEGRGTIVLNTMAWAGYDVSDDPTKVWPRCGPGHEMTMSTVTLRCFANPRGYSVSGSGCICGWLADLPTGLSWVTARGLGGFGLFNIPSCPPDGATLVVSHEFDGQPEICPIGNGVYTATFQPVPGGCGGTYETYDDPGDPGDDDMVLLHAGPLEMLA